MSRCVIWFGSPASWLNLEGDLPRLYVVTRQAEVLRPDDAINLEQAGLRGLLRVIGSEHPLLRVTQIDVDEHTDAEQVAQQLLGGSEEDETAWRNGAVVHGALVPRSAEPRRAANRHRGPRTRQYAAADPHAG